MEDEAGHESEEGGEGPRKTSLRENAGGGREKFSTSPEDY